MLRKKKKRKGRGPILDCISPAIGCLVWLFLCLCSLSSSVCFSLSWLWKTLLSSVWRQMELEFALSIWRVLIICVETTTFGLLCLFISVSQFSSCKIYISFVHFWRWILLYVCVDVGSLHPWPPQGDLQRPQSLLTAALNFWSTRRRLQGETRSTHTCTGLDCTNTSTVLEDVLTSFTEVEVVMPQCRNTLLQYK